LRRLVGALFGLERWNHLAYCLAALKRACACVLAPSRVEEVEVSWPGGRQRLRLLAGSLLNCPLPALPFDAGVHLEEPAFSLHLVPFRSPWHALTMALNHRKAARESVRIRIEAPDTLEIRLLDRTRGKFFLDENPEVFEHKLTLEVAGMLGFLPGSDYSPTEIEADSCLAARAS
jgi:hypothetical protein